MPHIDVDVGSQVPFTVADEYKPTFKAMQEQNLGIVLTQNNGGNIDNATASQLNTLNEAQLNTLMTAIANNSTTAMQYLHVGYDITGTQLSNFYLALVTKIVKVPNNGQDLLNAVTKTTLGKAIKTMGYNLKCYVIGNATAGTFHNKGVIQAVTTQLISASDLINEFGTLDEARQNIHNQIINNFKAKAEEAFSSKGITATVIAASVDTFEFEKVYVASPIAGRPPTIKYKANMTLNLTVDTDKALTGNSLTVICLVIVGLIIIGCIAAVTVPAAIKDWLISMTTSTSTFTEDIYGWVFNPNTGQYEWQKTQTRTGTDTNPDLGGIGEVGILLIGGVLIIGVAGAMILGIGKFKGGK